jgi:Archaeal fructose-1,6-bisphosphatase and related enzymes of inositol monophosphatase family
LTFGLVYVPAQKELFAAFKGEGATLNGKPIHVSESTEFNRELAICVYPHRHRESLDMYQNRMRHILDFTTDLRSIGSAALSLCYVASARSVLYYELYLGWYDMAAGLIILEEAGGKYKLDKRSDFDIDITAGSCNVFPRLLEAVCD